MFIGIVFIATVLIIALFFAWFFRQQAINKERLILIEKGENLDELFDKKGKGSSFSWLKAGVLILGLSFGVGVISLARFIPSSALVMSGLFPLFIIGLFGGTAMIIAHYIGKRQKNE